jgi:hypothetical protein
MKRLESKGPKKGHGFLLLILLLSHRAGYSGYFGPNSVTLDNSREVW